MQTSSPIAIITHSACLEHDTGGNNHPEVPERLQVILARLKESPLAEKIIIGESMPAPRQWLEKVHDRFYLNLFEEAALTGKHYLNHPDNQLNYDTFQAALYAAGAGIKAIDILEQNQAKHAFCVVRPPGHHAEAAQALGFCFLNNVAVAARYWQDAYNRKKIAIIDIDAHHGNGIQSAFWDDPEVLYISLHEHPTFSFPGTGFAEETGLYSGEGATINVPLPPGGGDARVLQAFKEKVIPAIKTFTPEALIIAAGFDAHGFDDMSGLDYTTELYCYVGQIIASLARRYCNGRFLSVLEGGYNLETLAASVEAYLTGTLE